MKNAATFAMAMIVTSGLPSASEARFLQTDPVGYSADLNLYTYVQNDPLDAIDPSGKSCVSDNKTNTTTCTVEQTGSRIPTKFSFATPKGWPSRIDNGSSSNHHNYDTPVSTTGSAARAQAIRQGIANDPTPGHDRPASPGGTLNDATPPAAEGFIRGLASGGGGPPPVGMISPVKSYTDKNGNTFNVTMPGHPLFPGYVFRQVARDPNGVITVHNYGEGAGVLQGPYSPIAPEIDNVWQGQTQQIIDQTPP